MRMDGDARCESAGPQAEAPRLILIAPFPSDYGMRWPRNASGQSAQADFVAGAERDRSGAVYELLRSSPNTDCSGAGACRSMNATANRRRSARLEISRRASACGMPTLPHCSSSLLRVHRPPAALTRRPAVCYARASTTLIQEATREAMPAQTARPEHRAYHHHSQQQPNRSFG